MAIPGLDFVEQNRRSVIEDARDAHRARAGIYARCFGTEDGKWVLEDLVARLSRPVAKAGRDISFAHQREGENNLIREIQKTVKNGKEGV